MPVKIRRVVLGLVGIIGLGIAFGVGRYFQRPYTCSNNTRCITISVDGAGTGKCKADYPVANLGYSEHVQWFSLDDKYAVTFLGRNTPPTVAPPPGSTPLPPTYDPENPLAPYQDPVYFDSSNPSTRFNVKQKDKYYYYAVYDQNYPNSPCKVSTDDQDTGLNVKR
jgi:hypothetical protein